jgi:hypothetical protein
MRRVSRSYAERSLNPLTAPTIVWGIRIPVWMVIAWVVLLLCAIVWISVFFGEVVETVSNSPHLRYIPPLFIVALVFPH